MAASLMADGPAAQHCHLPSAISNAANRHQRSRQRTQPEYNARP